MLHKNILTSEFKPKGFLIIYGCFNGATSSTSDCRSRGTQVEPQRKQSLFSIEKCFFLPFLFVKKRFGGQYPAEGVNFPPPSPTISYKTLFLQL